MSRRSFPYGLGDRPPEARQRRGWLHALSALEYEVRCLSEWDVLWNVLADCVALEPAAGPDGALGEEISALP